MLKRSPLDSSKETALTALCLAVTAVPAIALILFFLSYGFKAGLLATFPADDFYDWQAASMLAGHFDVPFRAISLEAVMVGHKIFGYFGPTPAIFRLPLHFLTPLFGHWSQLSFLCGISLLAVFSARMLLLCAGEDATISAGALRRHAIAFASFAIIGTPVVFLAARTYMYHEALVWGVAFAVTALFYISRIWAGREKPYDLLWAALAVLLAFLARESDGAGPLVALGAMGIATLLTGLRSQPLRTLIAYRGSPGSRRGVVTLFVAAAAAAIVVAINYAKVGELSGYPIFNHIREPLERTATVGNFPFRLSNFGFNFLAYFSPFRLQFDSVFPWIDFARSAPCRCSGALMDSLEPASSVTATMPGWLLLAAIGAWAAFFGTRSAWLRVPVACAAITPLPLLFYIAQSERYLEAFLPLLIVAGANGYAVLLAKLTNRATWVPLYALLMFGAFANVALAERFQGWLVWGVPDATREQYQQLQTRLAPTGDALAATIELDRAKAPIVLSSGPGGVTSALAGIVLHAPAPAGFCSVASDSRAAIGDGFTWSKPFLAPLASFTPCGTRGNAAKEVVVVATTAAPRMTDEDAAGFIARIQRAMAARSGPCLQQQSVTARIACLPPTLEDPAREYSLGALGASSNAVFFASLWSPIEAIAPFSGSMAGALTLSSGLPLYVYAFSQERTAGEIAQLYSIVSNYSRANFVVQETGPASFPFSPQRPQPRLDFGADDATWWGTDGWYGRDLQGGRWTRESAHALLAIPADGRRYAVVVNGLAGRVPTTARVNIENGASDSIAVRAGNRFDLVVPVAQTFAGRVVRVGLDPGATWIPQKLGFGNDSRDLGVFVRSLGALAIPEIADLRNGGSGWAGLLGDGWYEPDAQGARWTHREASAMLAVPTRGAVRLFSFNGIAGQVPSTVRIFINDQLLTSIDTTPGEELHFSEPISPDLAGQIAQLRIDAGSTWIPKALGLSADTRELGLLVQGFGFTEARPPAVADLKSATWSGLVGNGWYAPDAKGARFTNKDAAVLLAVPAHATNVLRIRALPGAVDTSLSVTINGQIAGEYPIRTSKAIQIDIPVDAALTGQTINVSLNLGKTWNPKRMHMSADNRELGIYVTQIGFASP